MTASSFVCASEKMSTVFAYVGKAAHTDSTVLITGETGTGKERVAEHLHRSSPRSASPFVCINCASLPEGLLESELFGYDRGAFTGAVRNYPGKLKLAQGGTVFLDEIGELNLAGQAKLLRVLESRDVFPLGGQQPQRLDVRFVAATNRNLEQLVDRQLFRQDLYFRLSVVKIDIPPLRERKEDIPHLLDHYLDSMSRSSGRPIGRFSAETLCSLVWYDWPGNVRELRNLVEALFVDPPGDEITLRHLPPHLQQRLNTVPAGVVSERVRIIEALNATQWNRCRAAEQLRWSRMTLYRKMAKYEIAAPPVRP